MGCYPFYGWEAERNQKLEPSVPCLDPTQPQVHSVSVSQMPLKPILWFSLRSEVLPSSLLASINTRPLAPVSHILPLHTTYSQSKLLKEQRTSLGHSRVPNM